MGDLGHSPVLLGENIMSVEMSVKKDLKCILNMPEKIKSEFNSEEEMSNSLPPYSPLEAYSVDKYDACPNNWMNGSDIASSYFVGVKEDYGMWLDFNECFYHTHDVAVVISIQGINPITGQKMVAEKALQLEQYHKKCPIHNVNFKQDRYCEKCGFKWPGQNYLSTTGTPEMMMWLDGFRSSDGQVRQYIITEDKMRGVASQIIGEERVFAIGIAYYLSKNKKPYMLQRHEKRDDFYMEFVGSGVGATQTQPMFFSPLRTSSNWVLSKNQPHFLSLSDLGLRISCNSNPDVIDSQYDSTVYQLSQELTEIEKVEFQALEDNGVNIERFYTLNSSQKLEGEIVKTESVTPVKKLEIGAGALIKQRIYDDPKMISYWEEKPAGMIYINYCDEETKKKIIGGGRRADEKDGFMNGIKVGGL